MMTRRTVGLGVAGAAAAAGLSKLFGGASEAAPRPRPSRSRTPTRSGSKLLTPEQYYVLRQHGTERAGTQPARRARSGRGIYACAGCDLPLFASETKFDSGTGWPSFCAPLDGAVGTTDDKQLLHATRTEVHCARCGGHLGHVFDDGPQPTGQRYCMNGVALKFAPGRGSGRREPPPSSAAARRASLAFASPPPASREARRAAGARDGGRHLRRRLLLVHGAAFDKAAGRHLGRPRATPAAPWPTRPTSRSAWAAPATPRRSRSPTTRRRSTYQQLLDIFWHNIDPLDASGQFCDKGDQYRSAIFYHDEEQQRLAEASKAALEQPRPLQAADRDRDRPGRDVLPRRGLPPGLLPEEPGRYDFYRWSCGRDARLEELWGKKEGS